MSPRSTVAKMYSPAAEPRARYLCTAYQPPASTTSATPAMSAIRPGCRWRPDGEGEFVLSFIVWGLPSAGREQAANRIGGRHGRSMACDCGNIMEGSLHNVSPIGV